MRLILALLPAIAVSPALVCAKPTIAVVSFRGINTSSGDAAAITEFVRNAVVDLGTHTVVDKANMEKILAEQAFQQTGCTSQACAVRLGKVLNAQKVIVGSYTVFEGTRMVSARVVDVETGALEKAESEEVRKSGAVTSSMQALVSRLLREPEEKRVARPKEKVDKPQPEKHTPPRICVGRCGGPRKVKMGDEALESVAVSLNQVTKGEPVSCLAMGSSCLSEKHAKKMAKKSGAAWVVQVGKKGDFLEIYLYDVNGEKFTSGEPVASVNMGPEEIIDINTGKLTTERNPEWIKEACDEAALSVVQMIGAIEKTRSNWVK